MHWQVALKTLRPTLRPDCEALLKSFDRSCLIIDPRAGSASGHHADWYRLLTQSLNTRGIPHSTFASSGNLEEGLERVWYIDKIGRLSESEDTDVIFLSGDDAFEPSLRSVLALRKSKKTLHYLLFRLSPQPRALGRGTFLAKILSILLIRLLVRRAIFYDLRMPIGQWAFWRSVIGLRPVVDSSFMESRAPLGKSVARSQISEHVPADVRLYLVIGVLGMGKHVDTILEAWKTRKDFEGYLLFAGSADEQCSAWIEEAAANDPTIGFLEGRLEDDTFESLIEAADVVLTLYRYSASSGIALRALSLGTRVIAGGSSVLKRQLEDVPNVYMVARVTPDAVAQAMCHALNSPLAPPSGLTADVNEVFPAPIVRSIVTSAR